MSWTIDPAHTSVRFTARHMMVTTVHGEFKEFDGTIAFDDKEPAKTTVDIRIDAASIDTHEPQRDGHLRSADFLNAEVYPALTFKSTSVEVEDDSRAKLHGDLTIRDVTKPVTLEVEYYGSGKTPYGKTVAGFNAQTRINRKDWGLTWNVALESGGWLVSDQIAISIEMELVAEAETEAAAQG
jgi:polyisoprenoid-binding protein YceI